ncbi:unnamed protein product, partial [Adineta steineri]
KRLKSSTSKRSTQQIPSVTWNLADDDDITVLESTSNHISTVHEHPSKTGVQSNIQRKQRQLQRRRRQQQLKPNKNQMDPLSRQQQQQQRPQIKKPVNPQQKGYVLKKNIFP